MNKANENINAVNEQNLTRKELANIFLKNIESEGMNIFTKEVEEFMKSIDIDEQEIEKIAINDNDTRKTVYRHLLLTGIAKSGMWIGTPRYNQEKEDIIKETYLQILRFKEAFKTLNKEQATLFTKKLINLFNESRNLEKAIERKTRDERHGQEFQVMIEEIEKIKNNQTAI